MNPVRRFLHWQIAFALIVATLVIGACNTEETTEVKKASAQSEILPAPLLLPGLTAIALLDPLSGTSVSVLAAQTNKLVFSYRAEGAKYAAIFIFKDLPQIEGGAIRNLASICVGGATNMAATHAFSLEKTTLSSIASDSTLFTCEPNSLTDAFSVTERLVLTRNTFASGRTYYWVLLGYDEHFHLSHSSSLREFVVE